MAPIPEQVNKRFCQSEINVYKIFINKVKNLAIIQCVLHGSPTTDKGCVTKESLIMVLCSPGWPGIHQIAGTGLELAICLLLLLKC